MADSVKIEAVADADAQLSNVGLPSYSELLGALRTYEAVVWDDCRVPGDMREKLRAVHHNVVVPALRAMSA